MKIRTGESEKMEGERRSGKLVECAAARRNSREGICAGKHTAKQADGQRDRRAKRQERKGNAQCARGAQKKLGGEIKK